MSPIKSDDEIQDLVQTIDDNADPLHADVTPSVLGLTKLGLPAAQAVLPLLDNAKPITRMRAFRVLGNIVMRHHGWEPGQGYADTSQDAKVLALMQTNGDYSVNAEPQARQEAITKWRVWLEQEMTHE